MTIFKSKWLAIAVSVCALVGTAAPATPASAIGPSPRIIGGADIDIADVPWTVGLMEIAPSHPLGYLFCGGSLIDESWVLTAAHCAEGFEEQDPDDDWYDDEDTELVVVTGKSDQRDYTTEDFQAVDRVIIHPNYDGWWLTSDVALLHLAEPIEGATPIALNDDSEFPPYGTDVSAYGWGMAQLDVPVTEAHLQGADLTSLSAPNRRCGKFTGEYQEAHHLCAGDLEGNKDSCYGDSGGPLVAYLPEPVLVGTTSWGYGCQSSPDYPGIYARTSTYASWINEEMNSIPPVPPTISIGDASVIEGNTGDNWDIITNAQGERDAVFSVVLDKPATGDISVDYTVVTGTATLEDFSEYFSAGSAFFMTGETQTTIEVPIYTDTLKEPNEAFTVVLENPRGAFATIARGTGTGMILNDDSNSKLKIGIGHAKIPEGDISQTGYYDPWDDEWFDEPAPNTATFLVSLNRPAKRDVTVNYTTSSGTAGAEDFVEQSGTFTIPAGATSAYLDIEVMSDETVEGDETFTVTLSGGKLGRVVIGRAVGNGTILNDD